MLSIAFRLDFSVIKNNTNFRGILLKCLYTKINEMTKEINGYNLGNRVALDKIEAVS